MTTPSSNRCPRCGAEIPEGSPPGLCPRCVLASASTPSEPAPAGHRQSLPELAAVQAAFPDFEIVERLGSGGMGVVFKARQRKLDRWIALKVMPQEIGADPAFAERFHREARFLARLAHPNIVAVHDFGQSGPFCFLTMEFIDGLNLRQILRAGRLSPAEALAIVPGICAALQYAHQQGVLHRDIKPENILVDGQGRVKLVDFGVAKLVGEPRSDVTLTVSGSTLGTPHYMAPEQVEKPSEVDHRADIYSLGVVFYEMLTGELPLGRFAAPSAKAIVDSQIDERIDAIVLRALAKERELRQQSADEVKTQVEGVSKTPTQTPPNAPAASTPPRLALGDPTSSAELPAQASRAWPVAITILLGIFGSIVGLTLWVQPFFGGVFNQLGRPPHDLGYALALVAFAICSLVGPSLAASWAIRCERARTPSLADNRAPAMPAWTRPAALGFAAAALLGILLTSGGWLDDSAVRSVSFNFSSLLLLASLALWRRNGVARWTVIVLGVLFSMLSIQMLVLASSLILSGNKSLSLAWTPDSLRSWANDALNYCWPLAALAMWHPKVRRAFGDLELPAAPPPSEPAGLVSRDAWLGRVLVIIGTVALGLFAIRRLAITPSPQASLASVLVSLSILGTGGLAAGGFGTFLGWRALRQALRRRTAGGVGSSFFAATCLPLLLGNTIAAILMVDSLTRNGSSPQGVRNALAMVTTLLALADLAFVIGAWRRIRRRIQPELPRHALTPGMARVVVWTALGVAALLPLSAVSFTKQPAYATDAATGELPAAPTESQPGGPPTPEPTPQLAADTPLPPTPPDGNVVITVTPDPFRTTSPAPTPMGRAAALDSPELRARIDLARAQLEEARKHFEVGAISSIELAKFERDLKVVENAGDPRAVARAALEYSDLETSAARQAFAAGKISTLELKTLETANLLVGIEHLRAIVASRTNDLFRRQTELDVAKFTLEQRQQQAAVGALAPEGREMLQAKNAVAIATAELTQDVAALAKVHHEASDRWLRLLEVLTRVGKATEAELAAARQIAERDRRVLEAFQPRPPANESPAPVPNADTHARP